MKQGCLPKPTSVPYCTLWFYAPQVNRLVELQQLYEGKGKGPNQTFPIPHSLLVCSLAFGASRGISKYGHSLW